MKSQRKLFRFMLVLSTILCLVCALNPMSAFAASTTVVAEPAANTSSTVLKPSAESLLAADPNVAELTVYADSDSSSSFSISGHAYITVKNLSTSSIQVGQLTGIAYGRMVSVGTWESTVEHTGCWYNLESYLYKNNNDFRNSVSLTTPLTSSQLSTVNTYIINHDSWTILTNCSSFASGLWNSVSSTTLSAGTPNTPTNLKASIKSKSGYVTGKALSFDYIVYYAQGANNPPKQSIVYK